MDSVLDHVLLTSRLLLAAVVLSVSLVPAWWVAGRMHSEALTPFFRLLTAIGLALVSYLSFVNLVGRVLENGTIPAASYLALSAAASLLLWRRAPSETSFAPLWATWRDWIGVLLIAAVLGLPQWFLAVSTPYWDEVVSSGIHLTAPNQFAEGVFPPRHNALPDVPLKYHYGFIVLSGTVRWLSGLSAVISVDIASTALWFFSFLFIVYWMLALGFARAAALWAGTTALAGGGLAWLYTRRIESYSGFSTAPGAADLLHRHSEANGFVGNLMGILQEPSAYLRNGDGSLSNLPWEISAQFQQHAVSLGIPLAVFSLYVFVTWQHATARRGWLLVLTVLTFSLTLLGHAVFGGVAAVTAGLVLLGQWLRQPTRQRFFDGVSFGLGVTVVSFLHGGLLATGAEYGVNSDVLTLRDSIGYWRGGALGFVHWNLAGFGLPLVLALGAWGAALAVRVIRRRTAAHEPSVPDAPSGDEATHHAPPQRTLVFALLSVFAIFSYVLPQLTFYSSASSRVEQFTEISKFFFAAHLGFALLSVFGVAHLLKRLHWGFLVPLTVATLITPIAFSWVHSTSIGGTGTGNDGWIGVYRAPYYRNSQEEQMGSALGKLKRSNRDVYFDASDDERTHHYLSEMLLFGGSVFTLTPSRFERTGVGFRLGERVVADRMVKNSRMARLRPAAAEECSCDWYYTRPDVSLAFAPLIVRSRFEKLVLDGYFVLRASAYNRSLFSIEKPTADLDSGIHVDLRPRMVSQASGSDGRLIFHDYVSQRIQIGENVIEGPDVIRGEFTQLSVGRFDESGQLGFLFGRMKDTEFRFGRSIEEVVERNGFGWSFRASASTPWTGEQDYWVWDYDVPLIGDLDNDGLDSHLAYRARTSAWYLSNYTQVPGPVMPATLQPIPFAGRFLRGSAGDLALWSRTTGQLIVRSIASGRQVELPWGVGNAADVLVPGDYDGDGYDEIATWNSRNQFWYWRSVPDGRMTEFRFGSPTGIPVPFDYNRDGRLDPAYWEPWEGRIYVTFTNGRSIDRIIEVPPNSIPAFINMF